MTVMLVTYDLRAPGRNYAPVHDFLKSLTYCKGLESVWLLDTTLTAAQIRDQLTALIDPNDKLFVTPILKAWASFGYGCADWLNEPGRRF